MACSRSMAGRLSGRTTSARARRRHRGSVLNQVDDALPLQAGLLLETPQFLRRLDSQRLQHAWPADMDLASVVQGAHAPPLDRFEAGDPRNGKSALFGRAANPHAPSTLIRAV